MDTNTDNGDGDDAGTVIATDGHPFWVENLRAWVDAKDLRPGDMLRTSAGTWVQVHAVREFQRHQRVHNLTIADLHTYHVTASDTQVLVHNCGDGVAKQFDVPESPGVYSIHLNDGSKYVGMSTTNIASRVNAATKPGHAVTSRGYCSCDIKNVTWVDLPSGVSSRVARRVEQTVMEGWKELGARLVNRRDPEFPLWIHGSGN